jgi:hypothetical protein
LIAELPKRRLEIRVGQAGDSGQEIVATTLELDRLDVLIDGRPLGSLDVADGENGFLMPATGRAVVDFRGFFEGELVAARRFSME